MNLTIRPREAGETAKDYAYRVLRDNICSLGLPPGDPLADHEIAELLGISRTPVREAVIQLKNEAEIIEVYPQSGMRVAYIDLDKIHEVRLARLALEKEVIRLCCEKRTEEDLNWLEENIALQQFYYGRQDMEKTLELDDEMHHRFFIIAGCEFIYRFTRGPMIHFDRVRSMVSHYESFGEALADHTRILEAVRDRNADRAEKMIREHLDRWFMNEEKLRAQYPEYLKKPQDKKT